MKQTQKKQKKRHNKKWPWIAAILALLVIAAVIFVGARLAAEKEQSACVYLREGSLYLQRSPGDDPIRVANAFDESGGAYVSQTMAGDFLLYPLNIYKAADGAISSYDLYGAPTRGRGAGKGFLIAQDVFGKPEELAEEASIFYLRAKTDGAGTLCAYRLSKREESVIDTNVTAFQQSSGKDSPLCYLRKEGGSQVLYAYNGTAKTELSRDVTEFHLYPTQASWELFYLKSQGQEGVFSLYKQTKTANAQLVAEGVASVRFDQYAPGGPLYYLCPSAEQLCWTDLIEDDKKEADAALQEPKLSDFVGGVLDSLLNFSEYGSGAYHTALTEYNEKLKRDKIREELSALDAEALFGGARYDCYAFTGTNSLLLAEGLHLDSLYAASATSPAIVSYSYSLNQKNRLRLSALDDEWIAQAQEEGWESLLTKLAQQALSPALALTTVNEGKTVSSALEQEPQEVAFAFSDDGAHLYLLEEMEQGGTLTRATVSTTGLTEKTKSDTNVSRYIVSKDTVYYLKGSNVQSGTLYKFTYSESVLIENDVRSLEQLPDGNLLYYQKSADGNTALFLLRDGEAVQIGEHVLFGSAKYSSAEGLFFIRNPKDGAGELCWYRDSGKTEKLDEKVQKVFF